MSHTETAGDREERELICIICPRGCHLQAQWSKQELAAVGPDSIQVHGNFCPRGLPYARGELSHPLRSLTTTVRLSGASLPLLPVKTASAIPKESLFTAMECLRTIVVSAPIQAGTVIYRNIAGSGVDVLATRSVPAGVK